MMLCDVTRFPVKLAATAARRFRRFVRPDRVAPLTIDKVDCIDVRAPRQHFEAMISDLVDLAHPFSL